MVTAINVVSMAIKCSGLGARVVHKLDDMLNNDTEAGACE